MASLRDIRQRIKSIDDTRQITRAMKLISAAKLKKARALLDATLPFFNKIQSTMKFILNHTEITEAIGYFDERNNAPKKKAGFIVITGDKGLAGGYNHNVIKLAENEMEGCCNEKEVKLFVIGNIGRDYFMRREYNIDLEFGYTVQNPTYLEARNATDVIIDMFNKREIDEVYLVYTKMINSLTMEPQVMKLLPLERGGFEQTNEDYEATKHLHSFDFEPSPRDVFNKLVPQYLRGIVYGALVEAFTSEQNARMSAMDNATRNADDLIKKFTLYYNRARQAAITQEISEVVGGAEAMK